MKIKRIIILGLIFTIFLSTFSFGENALTNNVLTNDGEAVISTETDALNIYSDAAIIIENRTGKTLYEKNSEQKMYPASTTKILTAVLTLENSNLNDKVKVNKSALEQMKSGYSSAYLVEGEILTVENLLELLLIHSANDASNVLAEHVSGSMDRFVALMNSKLQELGCLHTHFVTTNGLHDDNHYSTAKDMATIARYCMQNPTFRKIVAMKSCHIPATNKGPERYFKNTNDLLDVSSINYYPYCIGIKTGFTSEAKNCLISACSKNGLQTIAVVLGANTIENNRSSRYIDSKTLYDYAYSNYSFSTIAQKSSIVDTIEIKNATKETKNLDLVLENDITVLVKNNDKNIEYDIQLKDNLSAPVAANSIVGKITYTVDGKNYESNLLASHNVEKDETLIIILRIALAFVLVLILIIILICLFRNLKTKTKNKSENEVKENRK